MSAESVLKSIVGASHQNTLLSEIAAGKEAMQLGA
jgi:hypothetical protein